MTIITRFAPSPTGSLHLGGARTALFNWLYAKKHSGKFLLRIEDTDIERSKDHYKKEICNSLDWLGLKWDDNIFYQSSNKQKHIEIANILLEKGLAYKCYCTKDELKKEKDKALKLKIPYQYSGKCRDLNKELDKEHVIRIKNNKNLIITLNDEIQGQINLDSKNIEDFIIIRSDNTPTYLLSVVVDDYEMNITNVIRGDDHLTNTFKQIILYNALEWPLPKFAHIPLIYGQDGSKLSKRHGAMSILKYKEQNLLPQALNNYMLRLGWGYKDKEFFTIDEAIKLFSIKGIGKSPARFDNLKLKNVNSYYFKQLSNNEVYNHLSPIYKTQNKKKVLKIIDIFKDRSETINSIEEGLDYILNEDLNSFTKDAIKLIEEADKKIMLDTINKIELIKIWDAFSIEAVIKNQIIKYNLKMFDIAAPLRAAITGRKFSPSIYLVLEILGKKVSIARLKKSFL